MAVQWCNLIETTTAAVFDSIGVYLSALIGWYPMVRENPLAMETG